jgi:hypothetical protein
MDRTASSLTFQTAVKIVFTYIWISQTLRLALFTGGKRLGRRPGMVTGERNHGRDLEHLQIPLGIDRSLIGMLVFKSNRTVRVKVLDHRDFFNRRH